MDRNHIGWLLKQLPRLVDEGVLAADAADKLRRHYETRGGSVEEQRTRRALMVFGVLGALLIGTGIILVLAHNWEQLSRGVRAALSIGLLLVAQLIAGWALWKRAASAAWRESTAIFATLSIGATIALISQTYHIHGHFDTFVLTWLLLALPLVYLMDSRLVGALALVGSFVWAVARGADELWYWALLAVLAPYVVWRAIEKPLPGRTTLLLWVAAAALALGPLTAVESSGRHEEYAFFGVLAASGLVLGLSTWREGGWTTPLMIVGGVGVIATSLTLTFEDFWQHLELPEQTPPMVILAGILATSAAALAVLEAIRGDYGRMAWRMIPVVCLLLFPLAGPERGYAAAILVNVVVFATGVVSLAEGLARLDLRQSNAGLVLVTGVMVLRFFDADLSLVFRGLIFIAVGIAFLLVNVTIVRRRRGRRA